MTDRESRQDQAFKECLQEAYGCSDEQLLMEMERAEASLDSSDFAGAEDRIFQKIMDKKAAEEKALVTPEPAAEPESKPEPEKKVTRFRKKKVFLAVALVAVFMGALGFTAIGGKNYFFRDVKKYGEVVSFNNDVRKSDASNLEEAYEEIEEELGVKALKLGYLPEGMRYDNLSIQENSAVIEFDCNGNSIFFMQRLRDKETDFGIGSDRTIDDNLTYNKWLNKDIAYGKNLTTDGGTEYGTEFAIDNVVYYFFGIVEEEEFIELIKNLNFF